MLFENRGGEYINRKNHLDNQHGSVPVPTNRLTLVLTPKSKHVDEILYLIEILLKYANK